ncbi:PAS domain S-box protein [Pelotomaculum propionicicum]|uniref:PAS domain S-box protein n=1 Tax=Pelotomaculum propionicicum TaxID=258475 RepID=UPI003B795A51
MPYKKFFDQSPDAVLIFRGSDGSIIDANDAAVAAFACQRGELLKKNFYNLHISEDMLSVISGMEASHSRVIETTHRRAGTAEIPVIVKLSCAVVNDEKIFFCTARQRKGNIQLQKEIEERKLAEEALRSEKHKFESLLEKAPFGMVLFDENFSFKYVNPKFKELFGYDPYEVLNERRWLKKAFPGPANRHIAIKDWFNDIKALVTGESRPRIYTVTSKDGIQKTVRFVGVKLESGEHLITCEDITVRRWVETELHKQALFLQRLIDNIPSPIYYKDVNGVYQGCNKAYEALLGRNKNDIVGKSIYDLTPLDLADGCHKMDEALFREQGVQIYESSVLYADGVRHSAIINKAAYFNTDGTLAGVVGVISDIEERKKAEEELRQSEALLRSIVESPQNIITFSLDKNYRYIFFNKAHHSTMKNIWGADIQQGKSMLNYITYPEDREKAAVNFNRALSGEHFSVIEEYGDENLNRRYWEDIYSPIVTDNGVIIGVTVYCSDITDRLQAEDKLLATNQQLLDIIDFLPDATFAVNRDGRVIAWNRAIEDMTGVCKEDILGRGDYAYSQPFYGLRRPILIDLILLENSNAETDYKNTERKENTICAEAYTPCVYQGKGAIMWGKASPLYNSEGNIIGAIESIRDITDRKTAEEKLQAANQQLLDIIDFLPDATFVIDREGRVIAWNHVIEELTGVKKEDILGQGDYSYAVPFHGEPRPIFIDLIFADEDMIKNHYDYVRKEGNTFFGETYAQTAYRGKGAYLWVKASPLFDKGGEIVGAIQSIRDITGLKHLEERFRATGRELQLALEKLGERELIDRIIETSPAGILVVNNDLKITFANARAEQLLCLKLKNKNRSAYKMPKWFYTDYQGIPVPDEELVYKQVISTGRQVLDAAHAIQWPDGKRTLLSINGAPLYDRSGRIEGAVLSIEDVTLRSEAEERINSYQKQLRSLAAKLALVEERERRRIAEGIHDHIGQSLAVARLKLGALKKAAPTESVLSTLDDINALIEEAIKNTRSLTFELSPPILYDLGFGAAVEWLGEQLLEKNGVGFNLVNRLKPKSLGEELRIILFTIVRELFFNIVKHAGAKKVNILVQKLGDNIQVEVVDDGAGFDTALIGPGYRKNEGFGLFSIHERLEHLGGRLEIISKPGHGTCVTVEAPLANRD